MYTFIETYLHHSVLKQIHATQPLLRTLSHTDSEKDVFGIFQVEENKSPFHLLFIVGPTCTATRLRRMKSVLVRYAADNLVNAVTDASSSTVKRVRRLIMLPTAGKSEDKADEEDEEDAIQLLLSTVGIKTLPVVSLRIFDVSTGDVYVYNGATTSSGFTVERVKKFCDHVLSGDLAPVDLLADESDAAEIVELEVDESGTTHSLRDTTSPPHTHKQISVLFQESAPSSDGDEDEVPEAVQDLLSDESVEFFLVAFVSPATVQALLGPTATASGSDTRAALIANSHFAKFLSNIGQVLTHDSRFSAVRGVIDAQGSVFHKLMFPDDAEDETNAAVTFNMLDIEQERVGQMPDLRPDAECKGSSASECSISFDVSQLTDFIRLQVEGDTPSEKTETVPDPAVTVLFQESAPDTEDDEGEMALPEEVQDLLADESAKAFLVAFVSPATVQTLLGPTATASGSDTRAALIANSHFAKLVSNIGQALAHDSRFSAVRGVVDLQGSVLHQMMFDDEDEDDGDISDKIKKPAVTFSILDVSEERVVEMSTTDPNSECKDKSPLECLVYFDKFKLIEFINTLSFVSTHEIN